MTIGLSNSAKAARYSGSTTNQEQGGGDKKAGFPYIVGRSYLTSIYFRERGIPLTLPAYQTWVMPLANISHNTGRINNRAYWKIPGTGGGRGA